VHDLWSSFAPQGVAFIGVTKEDADTLKPWLDKRPEGERVEHAVVSDPTLAAERILQYGTFTNANPRAFIVKDEIVQWWGHPKKAEPVLKELMAGTWNPASIRDEFILESQVEQAKDLISASVRKAETTKDFGPPLTLIEQIVQQIPERAASFQAQKFAIQIGVANQPEAGYALGRMIAERNPNDGGTLRSLARTTLNNPWVQQRDVDFALEMARQAMALQPDDARSPEVLAMAWFAKGDREKAISEMERAVEMQRDAQVLKQFQATLLRYRTAATGPLPYAPPQPAGASNQQSTNPSGGSAAETPTSSRASGSPQP
jgi:tetratricopeptide (TPR) repeat protein